MTENKCKISKQCEHHTPSNLCCFFAVNEKFKGVCKYFNNYKCSSQVAILQSYADDLKLLGFVISKETINELEKAVENGQYSGWIDFV